MLVFSNDCTSGSFYKYCIKEPYPHPFIWNHFTEYDFAIFCNLFDQTDFNNTHFSYNGVLVDEKFHIGFRHYKTKEEIIEKYNSRVRRMKKDDDVIFVFNQTILTGVESTNRFLSKVNLDTFKYKIYIILENGNEINKSYRKYIGEKIFLVYKESIWNNTKICAELLYDKIKKITMSTI